MIQELYDYVVDAPVPMQICMGIGTLTVIAALRNLWKLLLPIRWPAAKLLDTGSFLLYPKKRRNKTREFAYGYQGPIAVDPKVPFDITSSKEAFIKTLKAYASTEKKCKMLTEEQVKSICKADDQVWRVPNKYDRTLRKFVLDRDKSLMAKRIFAPQVIEEDSPTIDYDALKDKKPEPKMYSDRTNSTSPCYPKTDHVSAPASY